jgi:antitoxin ParD1/3/4
VGEFRYGNYDNEHISPGFNEIFVDERLSNDGYGTASEYVRELIRADQKRREEEKLESLLLQRLQGDTGLEFDIEDVRAELAKRLNKKK